MAKPKFDSSKPFEVAQAEGQKPKFDASKPFEEKSNVNPTELESAARGAAQGATLGFADEISGGVEALWEKAKGDPATFGNLYRQYRDESRKNFKEAEKANPSSYLAGEIGGGVASLAIPGLGAARTAKGLATVGALAGAGGSESDLTSGSLSDYGRAAFDTSVGAATGAVGGVALQKVGGALKKGFQKTGEAVNALAERKYFEALGGLKGATDKAIEKGNMREIGRQAADEGIVTAFASKEVMLDRAEKLANKKLAAVTNLLEEATTGEGLKAEAKLGLSKINLTPEEVGAGIKAKIREEFADLPEEVIEKRIQEVDKWLSGKQAKTALEWQRYKQQAQKFIKDASYWKDNPSASQETMLAIRKGAKEAVEETVDNYAIIAGKKAGQVRETNRALGNNLEMADILSDRISRDTANQTFSLGDKVAAAGGAAADMASGGVVSLATGIAAGVGNKILRHRGDQLAAVTLDAIGKTLTKSSPSVAKIASKSPTVFKAVVSDLSRRIGQVPSGIRAADANEEIKLKGPDKWAVDGIAKLSDQEGFELSEKQVNKLLQSPKGKQLLISASDLKPGTKAMEKIVSQIKQDFGGSN